MDRNLGGSAVLRRPPLARLVRLCLGASLVVSALVSTRPATAQDLASLQERAQQVADEVSTLEHRLTTLEQKKERLDASIEEASRSLGALDLERQHADARYQRARARYEERAIEAYMNGPSSDVALILSAETIPQMYAVASALGHAAKEDSMSVDDMIATRTEAEVAQARIDERKQSLLADRAEAETVGAEIGSALSERKATVAALSEQIEELQEQARAALEAASDTGYEGGGAGTPADDLLALLEPAGPTNGIPDGFARTGITFEGTASWYGPGFEGQSTASGDIFDSRLYTAASKELPLHSWLYVEHEGRGIVVLINDRGPYVGDRILDLSHAAAQAIGISGLGWIEAEVLLRTD